MESNKISINIPNYSGPLEVLLDLAKSQKVDLTEISITKLADEFLDFIKKNENLNLESASEYLLMATWLAYLKSKLLLPDDEDDDFKALEVAEKLKLPFIYVRPESKGHGRKNQIEGIIEKNKKVFVVEDLISTANSSIKAIQAIKKAGMRVLGMSSIFTYELKIATDNLKSESIDFFSLSNYSTLIKVAKELNYINDDEIKTLADWNTFTKI